MDIVHHWFDVAPFIAAKRQPSIMIERELIRGDDPKGGIFNVAEVARRGEFWVPSSPLTDDLDTVEWSTTKDGEYVRVPVHGYKTNERALASILACGVSLGLRGVESFQRRTQKHVGQVVLVLGNECTDLLTEQQNNFRCYLGLAVVPGESLNKRA